MGIEVKGWIIHLDGNKPPSPRWEVKRALYIDGYIYTISMGLVKANSLIDLSEIAAIEIS